MNIKRRNYISKKTLKLIIDVKTIQPIIIIFTLLISFSSHVNSLNWPVSLNKVGEGTMSWMFLDIYDASLFSVDGNYQENTYPQALTINYLKNISKNQLIKATQEQWQSQGFDEFKIKVWSASIEDIWPDIKSGDSLSFYVSENKKGYFYHNQTSLGAIESDDFSDAFLSIWLSDKTSEPKLRRQLLGL